VSITPAVSAGLNRKAMHQLAFDMGKEQLESARSRRRGLGPKENMAQLRKELKPMLGDIDPAAGAKVEKFWTRSLAGAEVEALSLTVEDGIAVPLLLLRPAGRQPAPVVVATAQAGKERFLSNRSKEIEALLRNGIAVCLPDVRATGETAPTTDRSEGGAYQRIAQMEFDLGRNLLGSRLKDLRTVLAHLKRRPDIDGQRVALWGDSFAPPNGAEPMGAHLALLTALYEDDIHAVAARGGLAGYLTVLESAFADIPSEDVILGVLKAGDVADIAAALAPRPLLMETVLRPTDISAWLAAQLK